MATDKPNQPAVPPQAPKPGAAPTATPIATPRDAPTQFAADQITTPPTSAPYIDTLLVDVLMGPWRGAVLHLSNADAQQAIADKWAALHEEKPFDPAAEQPPALTDEELQAAVTAAETYATEHAKPDEPPPEGDTTRAPRQADDRREMAPKPGGDYETRGPGGRRR